MPDFESANPVPVVADDPAPTAPPVPATPAPPANAPRRAPSASEILASIPREVYAGKYGSDPNSGWDEPAEEGSSEPAPVEPTAQPTAPPEGGRAAVEGSNARSGISDEMLSVAETVGLSRDVASRFESPNDLLRTIQALATARTPSAPASAPAGEPEPDDFPDIDGIQFGDDYDEKMVGLHKGTSALAKIVREQRKEIAELSSAMKKIVGGIQETQVASQNAEIDKFFAAQGEEWTDVFGKGSARAIGSASKEMDNRVSVIEFAVGLMRDRPNRSLADALALARDIKFADTIASRRKAAAAPPAAPATPTARTPMLRPAASTKGEEQFGRGAMLQAVRDWQRANGRTKTA